MNQKEFQSPEFDDPIKLNSDSLISREVRPYKKFSRRDFFKAAGVTTAVVVLGALGVKAASPDTSGPKISKDFANQKNKEASEPANASLREMNKVNIPGVGPLEPINVGAELTNGQAGEKQIDQKWFETLKQNLGPEYSIRGQNMYFHDQESDRDSLVFIKFYDQTGTFNRGPGGEGGRETVVWVDGNHFYVIKGSLIAVSNDQHVYSYDETGRFWGEAFARDVVAEYKYVSSQNGQFLEIMVWDKQTRQEVSSGWQVDLGTGDLVRIKR